MNFQLQLANRGDEGCLSQANEVFIGETGKKRRNTQQLGNEATRALRFRDS